jgi:hypothetical protein
MLLENVVVRADPFQSTTEPETKFEPFTVSVKAGPPAVALQRSLTNTNISQSAVTLSRIGIERKLLISPRKVQNQQLKAADNIRKTAKIA